MEELLGMDDLEVRDQKDDLDVEKEKDDLEDLDVLGEKGGQGSRVVDERGQGGFAVADHDVSNVVAARNILLLKSRRLTKLKFRSIFK